MDSLADKLMDARNSSADRIKELISRLGLLSKLPGDFLDSLDDRDRVICLRATLLCYYVTDGAQIPREMQLRAVLADQHGKDYLVAAGTGSGKTLPMALNILLEDPAKKLITLTLSPLKRLQSTQENDFNTRYGIPTVVINEDTPRDEAWWNASHVFRLVTFLWFSRHLFSDRKMSMIWPLTKCAMAGSGLTNSRLQDFFCVRYTLGSQIPIRHLKRQPS
jgi:DEAD/DEAH box helicase